MLSKKDRCTRCHREHEVSKVLLEDGYARKQRWWHFPGWRFPGEVWASMSQPWRCLCGAQLHWVGGKHLTLAMFTILIGTIAGAGTVSVVARMDVLVAGLLMGLVAVPFVYWLVEGRWRLEEVVEGRTAKTSEPGN